ncbi:dTMP kinase [Candidatus Woesebacteria bacterium]|nr:dTMP kinase [Candidatus Woesebacteria bacterium]
MTNIERGKYIDFEGPGGAGKSTQIFKASEILTENGFDVITTREPGGTDSAESIRRLLFELKSGELIDAGGQMALFFAARRLLRDELIAPNLDKGVSVLTDRSYPSTGAYQGGGEGGDDSLILQMADVTMGECKPDAVLLFDIEPEVAMARNNPEDDPYDKKGIDYFARVITAYRDMAENNWGGLKWYKIDGNPGIGEVSEQVTEVLSEIFQKDLKVYGEQY